MHSTRSIKGVTVIIPGSYSWHPQKERPKQLKFDHRAALSGREHQLTPPTSAPIARLAPLCRFAGQRNHHHNITTTLGGSREQMGSKQGSDTRGKYHTPKRVPGICCQKGNLSRREWNQNVPEDKRYAEIGHWEFL